jgi:hypothetical protein
MTFSAILLSVLIALFFSVLLVYVFNRRLPGPRKGIFFIFLIIFMFTWAIGSWLDPTGPFNWGGNWLGYLIIGFMIMLLLGTLIPPAKPKTRTRIISKSELDEEVREDQTSVAIGITFGIFFWLMIFVLLVFAIIRVFD